MSTIIKENYTLCIIIPNFNEGKYIGAMLDSILSNDFEDWRCIVVDDGSTDCSIDILKKYAKEQPRITYFLRNRLPKGAQTCRNIGFEKSVGAKYIIWFDSDDIVAPYCLRQRVEYMERHPNLDFAIFPAKKFSGNIEEETTWFTGVYYSYDELMMFMHHKLPYVVWCNIYRRDKIQEARITWDENILSLQDSDFNIQGLVNKLKHNYAILDKARIDYYYRCKNNGISSNIKSTKHINSHLYFLEKTYNSLENSSTTISSVDICINILRFLQNFDYIHNSLFCRKLYKISWFKHHPLLWIKFLIYLKIKKYDKYLFKKAINRDKIYEIKYSEMEHYIKENLL